MMLADCLEPRPLGSSGMKVSALSLGSWRTYERLPAATGIEIMRAARDQGITFFDDARYNDETGRAPIPTGHSEIVFGTLFRAAGIRRDEVIIANKLWWEFWPRQRAAAELSESLERMGLDYIDLIYAGPPAEGMSVAEVVAEVSALISAGTARAWGVLNWPADLLSEAAAVAKEAGVQMPCAAQLPYSLARRSPVEDEAMTRALARAGAGVVASFCLEGGILSGKYLGGPARGRAVDVLDQPRFAPAVASVPALMSFASRVSAPPAAVALAFPLASQAVASVLFGATSAEQVRANCAAAGLLRQLSPPERAELRLIGAGAAAG
jgi:aryl-alcohol dehydrogenase-like predicted oxidoreductase